MPNPPDTGPPRTRSDLLSLLSEACELEHGLACSYLYAAFTIKQDLAEGGITWQQQQAARTWAAQVYFVASEEMLHLAQAWNLLSAIGGTPYYLRPNFPQGSRYYPLGLPLLLEPFGCRAVRRFVYYELPRSEAPDLELCRAVGLDQPEYATVGELYELIRQGIGRLPRRTLFLGSPANQVGPELVDFPDLIKVVDRESAFRAIDMITEQGEGTRDNSVDCHYGIFRQIERQLLEYEAAAGAGPFAPARPAVVNPVAYRRGPVGAGGTQLDSDLARGVCQCFDDVYGLMLRILQYVFDASTPPDEFLRGMARRSILLMVRVIKPLGEALTRIPAGPAHPGMTAGPSFALSRHVPLPRDQAAAGLLVSERLEELANELTAFARNPAAPSSLATVGANLMDTARS